MFITYFLNIVHLIVIRMNVNKSMMFLLWKNHKRKDGKDVININEVIENNTKL